MTAASRVPDGQRRPARIRRSSACRARAPVGAVSWRRPVNAPLIHADSSPPGFKVPDPGPFPLADGGRMRAGSRPGAQRRECPRTVQRQHWQRPDVAGRRQPERQQRQRRFRGAANDRDNEPAASQRRAQQQPPGRPGRAARSVLSQGPIPAQRIRTLRAATCERVGEPGPHAGRGSRTEPGARPGS